MGLSNVYGVPASPARGWSGAHVIDGKEIAAAIRAELKCEIANLVEGGHRPPSLATVLIGNDPASEVYVAGKQQASREVGIVPVDVRLPSDVSQGAAEAAIAGLNDDETVDGIVCQLPVPGPLHGGALTELVSPAKDVVGLTTANAGALAVGQPGLRPCTPAGVMELLARVGVEPRGKSAVVIGRSNLFGKPMAQMLVAADATVTMAHSRTQNLDSVCRGADILVTAVGRAEMIPGSWIKRDAVVVDAGINRTAHGLRGDVMFEQARHRASWITPVPGGVGPMTIAMLLKNTIAAYRGRQK